MAANVVESAVSQQVAQFSGSVVDVNGEPLIGVNVLEKELQTEPSPILMENLP